MDTSSTIAAHTSGSTGPPSRVLLRKEYMRASSRKTLQFLNINAHDRCLLCLPTDRYCGMMVLVRWWEGQLDLYPVEASRTPLAEVTGDFQLAAMVPFQVLHSLDELHRLQNLIIGGGPMAPELESELKGYNTCIYHSYGMTETLSHVALRQISPQRKEFFQAMPGRAV
ncbi:MAG: AMP-binding protein [Owenweeksia sp.]|nr:AMP-binding protein [Owenweeksia sp.]